MIGARSSPTFAIVFAVAYAVFYLLSVENNWALFTYHPALEELGWFVERPKDGPAMYWYGWLASAAIGAFVIAALTAWLPETIAARIAPFWSWLIPSFVMLGFVYILRNFFLR